MIVRSKCHVGKSIIIAMTKQVLQQQLCKSIIECEESKLLLGAELTDTHLIVSVLVFPFQSLNKKLFIELF